MSILIKVKLSQSLVGIRIESTRDEQRAVERRKNAIKTQRQLKSVCLSNADRSKRLNDREATLSLLRGQEGRLNIRILKQTEIFLRPCNK